MAERWNGLTSGHSGRVAGAVLAAALLTSGALAKRSVDSAAVDLPPSEAVAGFVRPGEVSSVVTANPVLVAEVLVNVGDELAPGQPLVRCDDAEGQRQAAERDLELERATQEVAHREETVRWLEGAIEGLVSESAGVPGQLALAERDAQQVPVRQTRDSPERARVAYDRAAAQVGRLEKLAAAGLVAAQQVEDARFALRLAADDLANAKQAALVAARVRIAQQRQARARRALALTDQRRQLAEQTAALEQARLDLKAAQLRDDTARATVADPFVRAPRAGAVVELPVVAGDRVAAGAVLARLAPLDPMAIDADVASPVVNALRVGDAARFEIPAAGVSGEARIRSIAPLPGDSGNYPVRLVFSNAAHARVAGQTARVWFVLDRKSRR